MKPLLKISTIPIKIEAQTRRATLQQNPQPQPSYNLTRSRGTQSIQTTPARVLIDQTDARANSGLKTNPRLVSEYAQRGSQSASEAMRNYNQQGDAMIESVGKGSPIVDAAVNRAMQPLGSGGTDYGPPQPPEIQVEPATISFDYQMDSLTFDWNINTKPQLEYVPAEIEYSVKQYPDVVIEYVGEPIYVPASSNPNYQGTA